MVASPRAHARTAAPASRAPRSKTLFLLGALPLLAVLLPLAAASRAPAAEPRQLASAEPPPRTAAVQAPSAPSEELARVREDFSKDVTEKTLERLRRMGSAKNPSKAAAEREERLTGIDQAYRELMIRDAMARLANEGKPFAESQFFVLVDANPEKQLIFLAYYDAPAGATELLGADLVSTGTLRAGDDSFLSPPGVYEHLLENYGYRAQGTKNSKGWRGLGVKGSRVWDFGFQQAPRLFRQGVYPSQMRLLMHATDPDFGEPRLGSINSKGCVRVSTQLNRFLDSRSILDKHYEERARLDPDMWLLKPDRRPVSRPGSFLIIGDSAHPASGTTTAQGQ